MESFSKAVFIATKSNSFLDTKNLK